MARPPTSPFQHAAATGGAGPGAPVPVAPTVALPEAPTLVAGLRHCVWLSGDGEIDQVSPQDAARLARATPPLLCHGPATARRLGCDPFPAFDLLELFAFVRPAAFCPPTPRGLAQALGLPLPGDPDAQALSLRRAAAALLREQMARGSARDPQAYDTAWGMAQGAWPWGPAVLGALGGGGVPPEGRARQALAVWERLPGWSEEAPDPPPGTRPVEPAEVRGRLRGLLGEDAEERPQQADYASAVSQAFAPRAEEDGPQAVLAEAGTGVGKTLGYIAPASLWAEKNRGTVWLSTFTRNLQHQIDGELDRLYPEPSVKAERVVVRKGRENYLCLLNYGELVRGIGVRPHDAVGAGLMARWAARTRDGDMVGGDFPGWLPGLIGRRRSLGLTDRRGECIYSACEHYGKCFIERSVRRARKADLVVANHALVLVQAVQGGLAGQGTDGGVPPRVVFDEGHHVFEAADSAFAVHLSGQETFELRRWLLGADTRARGASRARGLKRRIEDLVIGDEDAGAALDAALRAARLLTSDGWLQRLSQGEPRGPAERFLAGVRQQVLARAQGAEGPYSLETEAKPPIDALPEAATQLDAALARLQEPLQALDQGLARRLDDEADRLDSDARRRIEAARRGLQRRGILQIAAWRGMLRALAQETPDDYVDWMAVDRMEGREFDVGFHRHWVDPTLPFAEAVLGRVHGTLITSATLTDGALATPPSGAGETPPDLEDAWAGAEMRSGTAHLPAPALRVQVPSPFDYAEQTRVVIVRDVRKDDLDQVAAAYRELFLAAGGDGLGLFTAISRLRAVHRRIAAPLEDAGLALHAQHVDRLDTATLVEIFRAEPGSCLLGTDAVRDGVDVPGSALRLIVFDRVPWARPDIRHKARRERFGGRRYDDRLARLKLKQAFGRLIRRSDDRGVFVLLDPMTPSRLLAAFPAGVTVERAGLAEALALTRDFLI